MDKCAESMHIALQVFWFLQAAVEDAGRAGRRDVETRVRLLRTRVETAAVNGSRPAMLAAAARRISAAPLVAVEPPFTVTKPEADRAVLFPSSSAGQLYGKDGALRGVRSGADQAVFCGGEEGDDGGSGGGVDGGGGGEDKDFAQEAGDGEVRGEEAGGAQHVHASESDGVSEQLDTDAGMREGDAALDEDERRSEANGADVSRLVLSMQEVSLGQPHVPTSADGASSPSEQAVAGESPSPGPSTALREEVKNTPSPAKGGVPPSPRSAIDPEKDFDPLTLLTMKQERFDYFNDSLSIAQEFVRLSLTTRDLPQDRRQAHLSKGLDSINDILLRRMKGEPGIPLIADSPVPDAHEVAALGRDAALRSVHLPLTRANSHALRILRVNSEEAIMLTSRTRVPYMVNIEVLPTNMLCSDKLIFCEPRVTCPLKGAKSNAKEDASMGQSPRKDGRNQDPDSSPKDVERGSKKEDALAVPKDKSNLPTHARRLSEMTPVERQRANVREIVYGSAYSRQPDLFYMAEEASARSPQNVNSSDFKARQAVILGVYGELWSWKEERIMSKSPFRDLKETRLMPFIVKAGDDLRQEQLAIQLISQLKTIFEEEGVNVFLRPFTVMSVSSEAGFVEVITDAVSVHSLKKRTPNFVSLLDYFERAFGANGTGSFRAAQRRFIRSMAGYSLVTYLLQIKDRHNGNIMIDVQGRIIHIDFGFMLTNSPGAIKFESVPFKLTEEYLQVICAKKNVQDLAEASKTEGYRYFQELFVLGLLAARKHYEKLTTLVEIMTEGTTMPCMTGGHSIVESLRSRFAVGMPEQQCINFALGLIEESRLSWRSAGYDRFQAYSNGYR